MATSTSHLYDGPPQRWAINFSNGLEYVNTVPDLLEGRLRIFNYPLIEFDSQSFNWEDFIEKSTNETTTFYLHSLKWVDQLISEAVHNTKFSRDALDMACRVGKEWWTKNLQHQSEWEDDEYIWGGHGVALRATTLVSLSEFYPSTPWLYNALAEHLAKLIADFDGYWNHGLAQSLALMCTAARLGDKKSLQLGAERTTACLEEMIDEQGCINEQAPEYARYIERLIRVSIKVFRHNNIGDIEALEIKKEKIREFIGHAIDPGGSFVELGDSSPRRPTFMTGTPTEYVMSNGARGTQIPRVKIYDQGFIFGRSGFGNLRHPSEETYYTLRFGPQRIIHGHNDHTSITYWAEGRKIIVDPGHVGYSPGPSRTYVRSHEAHNVITARGHKHDWSAYTELTSKEIGLHSQSYTLSDRGYPSLPRTRTTCFVDCGPFVVLDEMSGTEAPPYITQRWNIAAEFDFKGSDSEAAWFESRRDGLRLFLLRYRLEEDDIHQTTSVDLSYGDRERMSGLIAEGENLVPAWNIAFGAKTNSFQLLTGAFVAPAGLSVGWSFREETPGVSILRIHIGEKSWAFQCNIAHSQITVRSAPALSEYGGGGIKHS